MTILAALAAVSLLIWVYLAVGHAWFWRTDVLLPPAGEPPVWPSVAIIVPARNEAEVLPTTLPSFLAQEYPGPVRIVLVDDRSADATGEVAHRVSIGAKREPVVVTGTEPPGDWTGKLWALRQGLEAARPGPGELVLFTDADIVHPPDSLRRMVAALEDRELDLLSQMALLPASLSWERLLIPAFVYFFAQLYPFRRVNRQGARTAAAAGGCVLIRWEALRRVGGVERIRGAVIDDVALARLVKKTGGSIWLGLSRDIRSCRPYPHLADVWKMVARSAFTQLRYSYLLVALTVLGLAIVYLVPPVAALAGAAALASGGGARAVLALGAGLAGWTLISATYAPMLHHHGRHAFEAPLLPLAAALYLLMTVDSARRHLRNGGAEWKGRRYSSRG